MRTRQRLLLLALLPLAAACGEDRAPLSPESAKPHFVITQVSVTCPDTISVGQGSQCQAYAYDQNNNLVSNASITWGTTTPSPISVSGTGGITGLAVGNAVVQATADGVTTSRNVYVKPGLSVSIYGPGSVKRFSDSCTWGASVSGGTYPYTFDWSASGGSGTESGSYFTGSVISAYMTLNVTVTDANGVQKTVSRIINANASSNVC